MREQLDRLRNALLVEFPELDDASFRIEHRMRYVNGNFGEAYEAMLYWEPLEFVTKNRHSLLYASVDTAEAAVDRALDQWPTIIRDAVAMQRELRRARQAVEAAGN